MEASRLTGARCGATRSHSPCRSICFWGKPDQARSRTARAQCKYPPHRRNGRERPSPVSTLISFLTQDSAATLPMKSPDTGSAVVWACDMAAQGFLFDVGYAWRVAEDSRSRRVSEEKGELFMTLRLKVFEPCRFCSILPQEMLATITSRSGCAAGWSHQYPELAWRRLLPLDCC